MDSNSRSEAFVIPLEIDDHYKRYRKEPWEVKCGQFGYCDLCNSRIGEFGYYTCGGAADPQSSSVLLLVFLTCSLEL